MKKYQVVMLPTEKASELVLVYDTYLQVCELAYHDRPLAKSQRVVIIEPEATIQIGNLVYNKVTKCICIVFAYNFREIASLNTVHKIIASTDSELGLLTIPKYFIDAFIEDQNVEIFGAVITNGVFLPTIDENKYNLQIDSTQKAEIMMATNVFEEKSLPKTKKEFILEYNRRLGKTNSGWVYEGENPFKKIAPARVASTLEEYLEFLGFDDPSDFQNASEWFDELETTNEMVNFDLLKSTIQGFKGDTKNILSIAEMDNLALFFQTIGKSSSFAHLAHKQLRD